VVEPTLAALAGNDDLLVLVTTGGRPVEDVRGPIPANARLARFLDYEALMPRLDLLVTNGGYGPCRWPFGPACRSSRRD
jgi:UDP:flavonoid glycosyltransferase YjiC (YdhE family)